MAAHFGGRLGAEVVIHEINFRPAGIPENTKGEFIELSNTGATPVDLAGWQFTKGVGFTFPAGTNLAAGAYLVVAADLPTFSAQHPGVANVVGNWSGSLANSGEQIKLVDALGVAQDAVTYYAEGDWALRVREAAFGGWDWQSLANGAGRTLELREAGLDNNRGQNWTVSAGAGGTPGAVNSAAVANLEPLISDVRHFPASPRSTEAVTISCQLLDETPAAGLTAALFWREATAATPGPFTQMAMTGDGAGKFSATLPARPNLAVVEFYVQASDGALSRTWPAPTSEGQNANCQYQVTNEVFSATDAYYLLVLTGAENAAYNTAAPSDTAGNKIDRQFNTTLVVVNGTDTTIRYRSQIRFRGNSSRGYQFKPLRVSIVGDDPWDGMTAFNLNPKASYLQFMGMRLLQESGVRAPDSIPVRPRRNGVEYTTANGTTPDYGRWVREEDINGDFVSAHFPEAKGGGIYKKIRPDRYWRNVVAPPANADGSIDGWLKQNNSAANDWSDLTGFFATAQAVAAPHFSSGVANDVAASGGSSTTGPGTWNGTGFSAAEITTLETVADLNQWARWFAVMTILQDFETNISNGQDDDYTFYFAPGAGGRRIAHLVTHDMDTIFGLGDNAQVFNAVGLYDATDHSFVFRPLLPLFGNNTTAGNTAFRQKYHDNLRQLLGTVFDADNTVNANPPFYQFVDNHLTGWVPATRMTAIKDFVRQRRSYLLGLIGSGAITPAAPTATATLAGPHGALFISEVLARNVAAYQNGAGFPDFIELRNTGATTADLGGMSLTDDPLVAAKYVFPAGTSLAAGGHLIVFADTDTAAPGLHTGFALDQDGDTVRLSASAGNGGALVDAVTFGPQATDRSIARTGAAQDVWALTVPTPNAVNGAPVALGNIAAVRLNEIATNPDTLFTDDFVELYNPGAQPVALGGVAVTDDPLNYPTRHVLPALSFMDATGFLLLRPKGGDASPGNPTELPFKLGATTARATLAGANGSPIDTTDTFSMPQDVSRGRSPDAGATFAYFGLPANIPTPGSANIPPPASVLALLSSLRITEIHYTPTPLEFIELRNIGATALDLSGVRFSKGIEYTFAAGTTLAPGAYAVVCADRAAFLAEYGTLAALAPGVFTGTLDNADDTIALQPPAPWDVNILSFTYRGSWYAETDLGRSLVVADAAATLARNWGDKATWVSSAQNNGSPGATEPPKITITSALAAGGVLDAPFIYQIAATPLPASYTASGLPAGVTIAPGTGLISGTPTVSGVFNVVLGATNATASGAATLVLTVSATGPLAGFAWEPIGPHDTGIPFTATLRARDAGGHTIATYNGTAQISASNGATALPSTPAGVVVFTDGFWTGQVTVLAPSATAELQATAPGLPLARSNSFVVTAVNAPPIFTKGPDQAPAEDAGPRTISGWATGISPGLVSETGQVLTFLVSSDNPALFTAQPAITPTGTLTYQSAPNVSGSATVTARLRDNAGGTDTSGPQTFTITVLPANDAPTLTAGSSISLPENSGPQSIPGWATGISPGPPNEAAQALTIQLVPTNPALFAVQPAVTLAGALSFTPATGASGTATVTILIRDDGGVDNGGSDTTQRTFSITLRAINHAPVFTPGGDVVTGIKTSVAQDWATGIATGAASESTQLIAFIVSADRPELFTVPPTITPAGRLTFTAASRAGLANITVRLKDDGGTTDGGADTSAPVTFSIRLTSAAGAAGVYRGLAGPAAGALAEHARLGSWVVSVTATGTFTARVYLGGNAWPLTGRLTDSGFAVFGRFGFSQPLARAGQSTVTLNAHVDFSGSTPRLVGKILEGTTDFATLEGEPDAYSGAHRVPASLRDAASAGNYTAAFTALPEPNGGLDATRYPRGDGWALVVVNAIGAVTVRGQLADGTAFTYATALDAANRFPFYLPLYTRRGGVGGAIAFSTTSETRLETTGLAWYRPAIAGALYPQGWRDGIALGLEGSPRNLITTPNALPAGPATLSFTDGGLTAGPLTHPVTIAAANRVTLPLPNAQRLTLGLRATGAWGGSFTHPVTRRTVLFQGVILGHRQEGTGYFLGGAESGRATFTPAP